MIPRGPFQHPSCSDSVTVRYRWWGTPKVHWYETSRTQQQASTIQTPDEVVPTMKSPSTRLLIRAEFNRKTDRQLGFRSTWIQICAPNPSNPFSVSYPQSYFYSSLYLLVLTATGMPPSAVVTGVSTKQEQLQTCALTLLYCAILKSLKMPMQTPFRVQLNCAKSLQILVLV